MSRRTRKRRSRRKAGSRLRAVLPGKRARRQLVRAFRQASTTTQVIVLTCAVAALWLTCNWIYQVIRKPSELFFPVSGTLHKTPAETWRSYAPIFRRHSTSTLTPEFLAALAQVEGSGNPVARTYWVWSWRADPFELYRPASSAVGMYQITDGTFEQARRYCIRNHRVIEDGPWHDWRSCWFNSLYARVVPSHAVELTSAYLDVQVAQTLRRRGNPKATQEQKQNLAAVIHLCGPGGGDRYVRHGFQAAPGQRCGSHDVNAYLARISRMRAQFSRLARKN